MQNVNEIIGVCLIKVAENVAKHIIQRTGVHDENDPCFRVDLSEAQAELMAIYEKQQARIDELERELQSCRKVFFNKGFLINNRGFN